MTEASLGDGIFPAREFLDAAGRFGIGTDSNVLFGVTDELRQLEYGQRLKHRQRNVLSVAPASRPVARYSTQRLPAAPRRSRSRSQVSRLGARADIVTLDTTHPSLAGVAGIPSSTAGFLQRARLPSPVSAGKQSRRERTSPLRQPARAAFNAAVRRLVA